MKFYQSLITVLIVGFLLIANIFLQRLNRQLTVQLEILKLRDFPQVGTKFDGVLGTDLKDSPVVKSYGQNTDTSLFLVFSPVCGYCVKNWPNWSRLRNELPSGRVVFADTTGVVTEEFMNRMGVSGSLEVLKLSPFSKGQYGLLATPTTIVIGPKGEVKYSYVGILNNTELEHIEAYLHRPK
jgi:hypothetical protein